MIERPTLLVVGAGGSAPYGYPLGIGLVDRIVQLIGSPERPGGLRTILNLDPQYSGQLLDFQRRLEGSATTSIDDFLEANGQYIPLGKIAIAAALTVWGPNYLHSGPPNLDWYRYVWDRLRQGAPTSREFRRNQLRIITYNYERSLEHFFRRVLSANYPDLARAEPNALSDFVRGAIPIVHVHGALSDVADKILVAPQRMVYNDLAVYREVSSGIRIVHEDVSPEYGVAHEWLRWAEVICFLGFGFHPTNVKRLDVLGGVRGRHGVFVGGTAYGLEAAEIKRAEVLIGRVGSDFLKPIDSLGYLRVYWP